MSLNQQKLLALLSSSSALTDEALEELQQAVKKYPYFQLGYTLIAKAMHDRQTSDAQSALHLAALYAPSRRRLKQWIMPDDSVAPAESSALAADPMPADTEPEADKPTEVFSADATSPEATAGHPAQEDNEQIYREMEDNLRQLRANKQEQESAKEDAVDTRLDRSSHSHTEADAEDYPFLAKYLKDASPSTGSSDEEQRNQMELIDKFINSERDVRIRWRYQEGTPEDLSERKGTSSGQLVTENLAEIYARQQKNDKAIEIYQQLILKYPDKKTYFAEKIESLKQN